MTLENQTFPLILAVAEVEETRVGIEGLLMADGYRVDVARNDDDAIRAARRQVPDLVLMCLDREPGEIIGTAHRVREGAKLNEDTSFVIFSVPTIREGTQVEVEPNIYFTHPDNFDQLRIFIRRLLRK
jgi:DNA-binding response OmpR family regulator